MTHGHVQNQQSQEEEKKTWVDGTLGVDDLPPLLKRALFQPSGLPDKSFAIRHLGLRDRRARLHHDPKTEPSPYVMFRLRMQREGRGEELSSRVRFVMREYGMTYQDALRAVAPSMGFVSVESEIRLYREHRRQLLALGGELEALEEMDEARESTAEEEFTAALLTLPSNAPKSRELEWIEAHPAMMRQSRNKALGSPEKFILVTADDILNAPHGVCPSRSAAVQLQHWANNSAKFFEQIMSEAKKNRTDGAGASGAGEDEVEDDLSELDDLLDFGS